MVIAIAAGSVPCSSTAQARIDVDLAGHIDFRTNAFSVCADKPTCTVGAVTLVAERRDHEGGDWFSAPLHWDVIDGIGVRDGGQDDEIDFNERIVVTFDAPVVMSAIWFSDLFHTEDHRYGTGLSDHVEGAPEDSEVAALTLGLSDAVPLTVTVHAQDRLPWMPFNQVVSREFHEDGELHRRLVTDGQSIRLVIPGDDVAKTVAIERFSLDSSDPEKETLFEGLETVEIDLTDILPEFNTTPFFEFGTTNFEVIRRLLDDPEAMDAMRRRAEFGRDRNGISNGEVEWLPEEPREIDSIAFFAPYDASNDFSVAGIVAEPGQ